MTDQGFGPPALQPLGYASLGADLHFKKWRTGGTVFGIIAIVIGGSSGCMGLLMPLALFVPQPSNQNSAAMISGALFYLVVAGALIWLGIGAIKMRRWVRPLVLTLGTVILISGVFSLVWMAFLMPAMAKVMPGNGATPGPPTGMFPVIMAMTMLMMGFFLLIIPAAFVWFYKKQQVKAALEHFDPVPRWTDRCPIPVLGLVVMLTLFAGTTLMAVPQAIMPVFGTVLRGPAAVSLQMVVAAAALVLAWLSYRCRPAGWWGTTAFLLVSTVAYLMTDLRLDQQDVYRAVGLSAQQIDAFKKLGYMSPTRMLALQLPILLLMFCYLAYVRKYFKGQARQSHASNSPTFSQ
jgi:hypothetical protein